MTKSHLTLKIFLLIVVNDMSDALAQVIMKKGLVFSAINSLSLGSVAEFIAKNAASPLLWAGLALFAMNFFLWIIILYKVDLSIAMPVGSLSYVLVPFAAVMFLHEHVGILRWVGIALIVLGVHFVSKSRKEIKAGAQDA